jgi:hypothetical protein
MKKVTLVVAAAVTVLGGCASYEPVSLPTLQPEFAPYAQEVDGITLAVKKFTESDSKRYFDRDIQEKGYQPIQISILNDSKRYITFSPQGVTLPTVPAEEVAEKIHTSTAGRATAYGVGALFLWPLAVPAIVDGVKSSKANAAADRDFGAKAIDGLTVQPYSQHNGVIFVPLQDYTDAFQITLFDRESREKIVYEVRL